VKNKKISKNKELTKKQKEKVDKIASIIIDLQEEGVFAFAVSSPQDWFTFIRYEDKFSDLQEIIFNSDTNFVNAWNDLKKYDCGDSPGLVFGMAL
jgi:hypothetical protein